MVDKLTAQQNIQLNNYLKQHPKVNKHDAIKLLFNNSKTQSGNKSRSGVEIESENKSKKHSIELKSGRKIVIKNGQTHYYAADGVELNQKYFEKAEGKIEVKPSGRYSVTKNGQTKYYAANGKELNEKYFKQVETNNNVIVKNSKGVAVDVNKKLQNKLFKVSKELKHEEENQGWMGKIWSGTKNLFDFGDSSDKVKYQLQEEQKLLKQFNEQPQNRAKIFKKLTGLEYNKKNLQNFADGKIQLKSEIKLNGYKEGQKTAVDVGSDIISGVASFGIYSAAIAAAPFTGGASLALGVAAAGVVGAGTKAALKYSETIGTDKKYDSLGHDLLMGAANGAISTVTAGLGGAVGKAVATRLGLEVVKAGAKEVAKQGTKQVLSQVTKQAAKQGFKRTLSTGAKLAKEGLKNPGGYKYLAKDGVKKGLLKKFGAYMAEGGTDGALSGGAISGIETAHNGGNAEDIKNAVITGTISGAFMGGLMNWGMNEGGSAVGNLFKGKKETTHIPKQRVEARGEVAVDAAETSLTKNNNSSLTPFGRGSGRGVDDTTPTPKPQAVKSTATISNKKLQNNIAEKMGKKNYEYYKKLDKEFFSDNTNLRLTSNFLDGNIESSKFLELRTQLRSLSENNPDLKILIANLSDEGLSSKDILKYLREFSNLNKKCKLSANATRSILRLQKSSVDSDSLLAFIRLKIENPNIKSFDLLKNYSNRYSQFLNKLNTISSNDIINEFRMLIKDAEFEGHKITRQDLKEIISNIKTEHSGLNKDELLLAKFDKEMFDDMSKIMESTPLKESQNISEYLTRINEIRKEQNTIKEATKFNNNKKVIEQNYTSCEIYSDNISLTPEELAEFNSRKDYFIKKAGDPSTKQGMGMSYDYGKEQKFLDLGLQNYERYNSTRYFEQNSSMKPYGNTGDYKYTPVIRFLDMEKSRFNTVQDLVESFPEKGGSYQAKALKCCFTTPIGSNENQIIPDVIIEIHPLSEVSQGYLIGGWGREVRYGGNQKFKVVDKYCKVEEADFGCGIKREIKGHVVLQEAENPPQHYSSTPKTQGISDDSLTPFGRGYGKVVDDTTTPPTPKTQGAKQRKVYEKPETEIKSIGHEDDIMTGQIVQTSKSSSQLNTPVSSTTSGAAEKIKGAFKNIKDRIKSVFKSSNEYEAVVIPSKTLQTEVVNTPSVLQSPSSISKNKTFIAEQSIADKQIIEKLKAFKNANADGTYARFNDEEVKILVQYYKKDPEFFESVLNEKFSFLGTDSYKFDFDAIDNIMKCYEKNEKLTKYLYSAVDENGNNFYYLSHFKNMVDAFEGKPYDETVELLHRLEKFAQEDESASYDAVCSMIEDKNQFNLLSFKMKDSLGNEEPIIHKISDLYHMDYQDIKKISKIIENGELEKLIKIYQKTDGSFDSMCIKAPREGEFQIRFAIFPDLLDSSQRTVDFKIDKQGKIIFNSKSEFKTDEYGALSHSETTFSNGSKVNSHVSGSIEVGPDLKTELYDKNGKLLRRDEIISSRERIGEYEITVSKPDDSGNLVADKIGTIKMFGSKKQGSRVRRRVTSPSGVVTREIKIKGPKGTGTEYKVLDKKGNILYESKRIHTKIGENHYVSTHNGQRYDIKFENDKITVSKLGENSTLSETITLDSSLVDPQLIDMYKQLPGDYFYKLKQMNCKVVYSPVTRMGDRSCFNFEERTIYISERSKNNPQTFAHEFGHALDHIALNDLCEDKVYRSIFKEEWTNFVKTSGTDEKDVVHYYTQNLDPTDHNPFQEFIAQVDALISGFDDAEHYEQLANALLQQNFSRSLAYVAKKLEAPIDVSSIKKEFSGLLDSF